MKSRTGAVLFWLAMGLVLSGVAGAWAAAPEIPAALQLPPAAPPVAAADEPVADVPAAEAAAAPEAAPSLPPPEQRLAALKDADLETLKAAEAACMKAAEAYSASVPELYKQMRATYEDVEQNDPAIQGLKKQIAELNDNLNKLLLDHPAVVEKHQAIDRAQQDMLAELRLRTELEGLISLKESEKPTTTGAEAAE